MACLASEGMFSGGAAGRLGSRTRASSQARGNSIARILSSSVLWELTGVPETFLIRRVPLAMSWEYTGGLPDGLVLVHVENPLFRFIVPSFPPNHSAEGSEEPFDGGEGLGSELIAENPGGGSQSNAEDCEEAGASIKVLIRECLELHRHTRVLRMRGSDLLKLTHRLIISG